MQQSEQGGWLLLSTAYSTFYALITYYPGHQLAIEMHPSAGPCTTYFFLPPIPLYHHVPFYDHLLPPTMYHLPPPTTHYVPPPTTYYDHLLPPTMYHLILCTT